MNKNQKSQRILTSYSRIKNTPSEGEVFWALDATAYKATVSTGLYIVESKSPECNLAYEYQELYGECMYFTIRKSTTGKYWWRIVADGNNEVLASSELLASKTSCYHAIGIVQAGAHSAPVYDKTGE